ncbi:MAG: signal recognition particle-docking protein FtsY [Caldilineaceae bacterium SB0662_bin_9]|uniref:Signal recognition particle receptor FtsY n=1 Tax=Caldilineaceae bacterium SB0662_bin_9 TaxID=2605258 RepID=A0A6B1DQH1_9CHLR|nr:signal recognition particle-docking protein FtsY [Caldilineaceae bacterium SB0666_bin_21]MYD89035.1 signal recognition particle-docking protein FtsY [Caldilineaceae bacterium SB0662_bin_9]
MFGKARNEDRDGLNASLAKTRQGWLSRIRTAFRTGTIADDTWEEIEEYLVMGDAGLHVAEGLIADTRDALAQERDVSAENAYRILQRQIQTRMTSTEPFELERPRLLTVAFVIGVNGAGKTTTIGKLANYYRNQDKRVVVAAADTYRAAAIDQLRIWCQRARVDLIAQQQGSDPGAVVYDAIRASQESRKADMVLVDTAGRLHTRQNLMRELQKMRKVANRQVHGAPHEVLLVLDATAGQNALEQARRFTAAAGVTGIVVTKLDGSSKGGAVIGIRDTLGVPVRFAGVGEGLGDLLRFDPAAFASGLFEQV